MCVSKVQKNSFFPTHDSLPSDFVHFFSHMELLFIVIQILINIIIVIICSIINTKKVKAGNLAEKNRHSAGKEGEEGEEGGKEGSVEGVWTHNRNISNRYMLSTSDKEDGASAFETEDIVVSGQSLAASEHWSVVEASGRCCSSRGNLKSPAWPLYCIYLHWVGSIGREGGRRRHRAENTTAMRGGTRQSTLNRGVVG